jgi:phosphoserine phosphatase RsbU/P
VPSLTPRSQTRPTDGRTDTVLDGEFLGQEGLACLLADGTNCNAAGIIDELSTCIAQFDPPPRDDIALLAMSVPATQ